MPGPYIISASILSADFRCLGEQIKIAEDAGIDRIHVDVMDGHFVPNLTMGPFIVKACDQITERPIEVHLMVERPDHFVEAFARAGADILTVHVEACPNLYHILQTIRQLGCKAGVSLNPGTPAVLIEPVLHLVDQVLVMSVNPGASGQVFQPEVLPKVVQIRRILDAVNPKAMIEMDGGLNAETIPLALHAGVQVFVAAHAIFDHPQGIKAGVQVLKACFPV
jgi:ribulose-phosphate 3-epimerase